jgi:hypothetical protein
MANIFIWIAGDIVMPTNSSAPQLRKKMAEEFDVRDTMSEPRVDQR